MAHHIQHLANTVLDFAFPPYCTCCRQLIGPKRATLCQTCFDSLRLVDPANHCPKCGLLLEGKVHRCHNSSLEAVGVCFDDGPVARSLLNSSAGQISPFIVLQWHTLQWPLPDFVMPTPGDWFSRGSDLWRLRQEIAAQVAAILGRQSSSALMPERHRLPIPYLGLEEQGREVEDSAVRLRHPNKFVNKTVLLIHDTLTTGRALRTSASALCHYGARAVWGISIRGC
jgi:predicted amidophosphoribosyltransferase